MAADTLKNVFQLKITLEDVKPQIMRKVLVPSNLSLGDLHTVIQIAMGWTDSHLHQFIVGGMFYCPEYEDNELESKDESKFKVSQVLKKEKDKLIYEYDFGDGWLHDIQLEKILPFDNEVALPSCIAGKRACPPEDCGGAWGYKDLVKIVTNPKHPEHEEMLDWLGGEFDPDAFDIEEVNNTLAETFV